ncbi:MAG: hypothetical protein V7K40_00215 [Nostoc sp.]|uniref:hypothetical protein n=1 Tax=Nostoc sp. TaxID=1180 RepID=UPI002FFC76DE
MSAWEVESATPKRFRLAGNATGSWMERYCSYAGTLTTMKIFGKVQSNPVTANIVDINPLYISF